MSGVFLSLLVLQLPLFVLSTERIVNPSVIHISPFAKFKAVAGRNESVLFEDVYEPLLNNPRWIFEPFIKEALNNGEVTVSHSCATQVLKVIEDFPEVYAVKCEYKLRNLSVIYNTKCNQQWVIFS